VGSLSSVMNSKPEIAPVIHAFGYQLLTSSRSSAANLFALDSADMTSAARESVSTLLPNWPK